MILKLCVFPIKSGVNTIEVENYLKKKEIGTEWKLEKIEGGTYGAETVILSILL